MRLSATHHHRKKQMKEIQKFLSLRHLQAPRVAQARRRIRMQPVQRKAHFLPSLPKTTLGLWSSLSAPFETPAC